MPIEPRPIEVMIADDHELIRVGIKKIIRSCRDMQLIGEAPDLNTLFDLLEKQRPDVLILDISLPPYDGLDGLLEVRERFPDLPVLMLSMYPEERFAVPAVKSGASGYITKAMAADELVNAIRKVKDGGSFVTPRLAELLAEEVRHVRPAPLHETLTEREKQIALLLAAGFAAKQIAAQLEISVSSINTYRARILKKLELTSKAALIRYVIENRLADKG